MDGLGEKGGGEDDRVVDGDIYHYGIFFLTWTSKHEKDDLLEAHGSFLFIACQNTLEDPLMDSVPSHSWIHVPSYFWHMLRILFLDSLICILLPLLCSELLHKRARFSHCSMI